MGVCVFHLFSWLRQYRKGIGENSGCQQLWAAFVVAFVLSAVTQNACGPLGLKSWLIFGSVLQTTRRVWAVLQRFEHGDVLYIFFITYMYVFARVWFQQRKFLNSFDGCISSDGMVPTSQIYSWYINQLRVAVKKQHWFSLLFQCFHSKTPHPFFLPQRLCAHPNTSRYLGSVFGKRRRLTGFRNAKMVETISFAWCFTTWSLF